MSEQTRTELGMHVRLSQPYEVALERAKAALKAEGFGARRTKPTTGSTRPAPVTRTTWR